MLRPYILSIVMVVLGCIFAARTVQAAQYDVDYKQSSITFSGEHIGDAFTGVFETWNAMIAFDSNDLKQSNVSVEIDPASAKTGSALYDKTLPTADWFNVKQADNIHFVSDRIKQQEDGTYRLEGQLTIRNITQPLAFTFTLNELENEGVNTVEARGEGIVPRLAFNIGADSDPKGEWVSKDIKFMIIIRAKKL